jgi:HK97 family phage portal protein
MMPTLRALLSRVIAPLVRGTEGEPRPGPWQLPVSGGWLTPDAPSYGNYFNWWQMGGSIVGPSSRSAIVESCVSAYAQTVAMCPGDHWRANDKGGRDRVTTSALSRVLRRPNSYQSISDFLLNATRSLYLDGNSFALALRNDRYEIAELHLMSPRLSVPLVAETGDVFYRLGGNDVIDRQLAGQQLIVPQRDVLHIRLHHTDRRYPQPLLGETPLAAAFADLIVAENIRTQQANFFRNEARPSAVLSTDLVLDKDQVASLRDRWNEQAKGLHQGGVPILTGGLKVQPWTAPALAKDAQVAELLKLTEDRIALVFRVPLAILGLGNAPFASTEALLSFWLASGLGFCLNHVEEAFDRLFGLAGEPTEYTEFNTSALLRSAQKDRIDALVRGVQGGVYAPNEARNSEGLNSVPFGDEPRVQQQVVPLSAASAIPAAPGPAASPAAPSGEASANYQDAVKRDLSALRARVRRPNGSRRSNGVAEPRTPVIRKTKLNALQRSNVVTN